jgi:diaminopimelate epimerase
MALPARFVKMSGGGNDFLLFEADGRAPTTEDRRRLALLCRRGLSVGADGALFLSGAPAGHLRLDYFNADGELASFCANGTRCAARYAVTRGLVSGQEAVLETGWGEIPARVEQSTVTLSLPTVSLGGGSIPISLENLPPQAFPIEVGVPHLVVFVGSELPGLPVERLAPPLRHHARLPDGANVNFVHVFARNAIAVRSYERGVEGETLACGSGVVASAIVAARQGLVSPPLSCDTRSGARLTVSFREENGAAVDVRLAGDAREIYSGQLTEEAWQE